MTGMEIPAAMAATTAITAETAAATAAAAAAASAAATTAGVGGIAGGTAGLFGAGALGGTAAAADLSAPLALSMMAPEAGAFGFGAGGGGMGSLGAGMLSAPPAMGMPGLTSGSLAAGVNPSMMAQMQGMGVNGLGMAKDFMNTNGGGAAVMQAAKGLSQPPQAQPMGAPPPVMTNAPAAGSIVPSGMGMGQRLGQGPVAPGMGYDPLAGSGGMQAMAARLRQFRG